METSTSPAHTVRFVAPDEDRPSGSVPILTAADDMVRTRALALTLAIGEALHRRHQDGNVFGDLRPGSIRLDKNDDVALLLPEPDVNSLQAMAERAVKDTRALLDVAYVAPEIIDGGRPTEASDVYALAALLLRLLSGKPALAHVRIGDATGSLVLTKALVDALATSPDGRGSVSVLCTAIRAALATSTAEEHRPRTREEPTRKSRLLDDDEMPDVGGPFAHRPAPSLASASDMSFGLSALLVVGGVFVFVGALWLAMVTWDVLDEVGRSFLMFGLTGAVAVAGVVLFKRGWNKTGSVLMSLGTQLVWADIAYVVDVQHIRGEEPWLVGGAVLTLFALSLALTLKTPLFALVWAADASVLALIFGSWISTGSPLGPMLFPLFVATGFAGFAWLFRRREGNALRGTSAATSALWALGASLVALGFLFADKHVEESIAVQYLLLALSVVVVRATPSPFRTAGMAVLLPSLTLPTLHALVLFDDVLFTTVAVIVGVLVLTVAFVVVNDARDASVQIVFVFVGVAHTLASPMVRAWESSNVTHWWWHRGPTFSPEHLTALGVAVGLCVGVVLTGILSTSRAHDRLAYRMCETLGAMSFGGLLSVLSWGEPRGATYVSILVMGLLLILVVGIVLERASLLVIACGFLAVNAVFQFFAKLTDYAPTSVVLIGFGIILLASGFVVEKRIRAFAPRLATWH